MRLAAARHVVGGFSRYSGFARCTAIWQFSIWVSAMRCPICKRPIDMTPANRFRPFCSERCRMVDLGTWAGEGYRVPGAEVEDREHPDDRKKKLLN
jgi:endogenous inhibitor of DNA gyrase (YacG/DUF329 family)